MTAATIPPKVHWLLLAAAGSVAIGMALLVWKTTAIGSMLFMNHGVAHGTAVLVERALACVLVAFAGALFVRRLRAPAAAFVLVVVLFLAWASVDQAGYPFSRFAFGAHALRIAAPLVVIVVLLPGDWREGVRRRILEIVLMAAAAVTFVVHGFEALSAHPWFVDLTIGAFQSAGLGRISQAGAERILFAVGVVDFVAALALVVLRKPWVAAWFAFWGLFTAFLRPFNYGSGSLGEFVVRLPHVFLPLALLLLFRTSASPSKPRIR